MEEAKPKKMDAKRFRDWIEGKGAMVRINNNRLECVINIDHIEPGHFAAFYLMHAVSDWLVVELAGYFAGEASAWAALQDEDSPTHSPKLCTDWMKEQYLTDKSARVERLAL